jgi:hypothetical protein
MSAKRENEFVTANHLANPSQPDLIRVIFALRAHCGRDARGPRKSQVHFGGEASKGYGIG